MTAVGGAKLDNGAVGVRLPILHLRRMGALLTDRVRAMDPLNAEWVALLLLGVFSLLGLINTNSPRKWRLLSQAVFRMRLGRHALREELALRDRTFIGLLVVAVCMWSLYLWQLAVSIGVVPMGYPEIALVMLVFVGAQVLLVRGVMFLLNSDGGLHEHLYTGLLLFILAGVLLAPLVVLIAYRPDWRAPLLWTGGVVLVSSFIFRWVRALWIGAGERVPARYIIIYLCGAEILPLFLIIHFLRRSVPSLSHL